MTKTTTELIRSASNQGRIIYNTMNNIVAQGNSLTWPQINSAIDTLRRAESEVLVLINEMQNPSRNIEIRITAELGRSIDLQGLFSLVLAKGEEFTAAALSLFEANNTRESYEEDGKTKFREVVFRTPAIDSLNAIVVEIRTLVQDFNNQ